MKSIQFKMRGASENSDKKKNSGVGRMKNTSRSLRLCGEDIKYLKNDNNEDNIEFSTDPAQIKQADFVLICVPTPVTKSKEPDLRYVKSAAEIIGQHLKKGAIVVLESTIYPGVTEEIVKPILECGSGLKYGADFKIGYSSERINPGDEAHALTKITKIVAGMDKLFCKQKPLLKIAYAIFCFAKRNISLVKLSF